MGPSQPRTKAMDARQRENLLQRIMEVERKFSAEKKNARSERKAELKELIEHSAAEVEKNATSKS